MRAHPAGPNRAHPNLPKNHALRPLLLRHFRHGRRVPTRLLLRQEHLDPRHCAWLGVARSPRLRVHRQRTGG